jgi:hypothetical protein
MQHNAPGSCPDDANLDAADTRPMRQDNQRLHPLRRSCSVQASLQASADWIRLVNWTRTSASSALEASPCPSEPSSSHPPGMSLYTNRRTSPLCTRRRPNVCNRVLQLDTCRRPPSTADMTGRHGRLDSTECISPGSLSRTAHAHRRGCIWSSIYHLLLYTALYILNHFTREPEEDSVADANLDAADKCVRRGVTRQATASSTTHSLCVCELPRLNSSQLDTRQLDENKCIVIGFPECISPGSLSNCSRRRRAA